MHAVSLELASFLWTFSHQLLFNKLKNEYYHSLQQTNKPLLIHWTTLNVVIPRLKTFSFFFKFSHTISYFLKSEHCREQATIEPRYMNALSVLLFLSRNQNHLLFFFHPTMNYASALKTSVSIRLINRRGKIYSNDFLTRTSKTSVWRT